jgi:hypothetical protein
MDDAKPLLSAEMRIVRYGKQAERLRRMVQDQPVDRVREQMLALAALYDELVANLKGQLRRRQAPWQHPAV